MNRHREAYHIMLYRCDKGHDELLWNTRDGVTPFGINCIECGSGAYHENWEQDVQTLKVPATVRRVFVDARPDHKHLIQAAKDYVEKYWDDPQYPMSSIMAPMDKKAAAQHFLTEWTQPGSPTIISREEYERSLIR